MKVFYRYAPYDGIEWKYSMARVASLMNLYREHKHWYVDPHNPIVCDLVSNTMWIEGCYL